MARLLAVVGALALALAAWLLWRDPGPAPATPTGTPPTAAVPQAAPAPAAVPPRAAAEGRAAPPAAKATEQPDWMAFPDGSALPPLNGVTKSPKLTWHRMLPYTKVVGTERDAQGREWYVHENGARSTTYFDPRGQ